MIREELKRLRERRRREIREEIGTVQMKQLLRKKRRKKTQESL